MGRTYTRTVSTSAEPSRIYSFGTPIERAMEHVVLDEQNCWLWDGAISRNGYANMGLGNGKFGNAHVVTYEHFRGSIPEGMEIDHLCRVRECVNPWHLEAVTHQENVSRGHSPSTLLRKAGRCKRGHSLADAYRRSNGNVANCRTCRLEKRRAGEWS